MSSKHFLLDYLCLLFLIIFAIFSVQQALLDKTLSFARLLQAFFILLIYIARFKTKKQLFFIPDLLLASLPWFWFSSINEQLHNLPTGFVQALAVIIALLFVSSVLKKDFFNFILSDGLCQAIFLSVLFYYSFSFFLYRFFPLFTKELYNLTIFNGFWCFAGIPFSHKALAAFFPSPNNGSEVAAPPSLEDCNKITTA